MTAITPEPISSQKPRRLAACASSSRSRHAPLKIRYFVGEHLQAVDLVANAVQCVRVVLDVGQSLGILFELGQFRGNLDALFLGQRLGHGVDIGAGLHVRETVQEAVRLLLRLVKDFAEFVPLKPVTGRRGNGRHQQRRLQIVERPGERRLLRAFAKRVMQLADNAAVREMAIDRAEQQADHHAKNHRQTADHGAADGARKEHSNLPVAATPRRAAKSTEAAGHRQDRWPRGIRGLD